MKKIAHRGNYFGRVPERENNPHYVLNALEAGFDAEIDVWFKDDRWYLGHDEPLYGVPEQFLRMDGLWLHAKNLEALQRMQSVALGNYFWHESDQYTLTSHRFIWTCNEKILPHLSSPSQVILMSTKSFITDMVLKKSSGFYLYGICADNLI